MKQTDRDLILDETLKFKNLFTLQDMADTAEEVAASEVNII